MSGPTDFSTLLHGAIEARGMTLGKVRSQLRRQGHDVSVATLSYWRRGLARPTRATSLAAVGALERILDLRPDTLAATLRAQVAPEELIGADVDDLARRMDLPWTDNFVSTGFQDVIVIDTRDMPVSHRVRETLVAKRAGARTYPAGFWNDDPSSRLRVEPVAGCRVVRSNTAPGAVVAEVELPRALEQGEAWTTEFAVVTENGVERFLSWSRLVASTVRILHFSIVFEGGRVPLRARLLTEVRGVQTETPLVLRDSTLVVHLEDFGPGEAVVQWEW